MAGEGAAFFVLSNQESGKNKAELRDMHTLYNPSNFKETESFVSTFLEKNSISRNEIDLVVMGNNGDRRDQAIYDELNKSVFNGLLQLAYKQYCGEYPTSTSFAVWLATHILENKTLPSWLLKDDGEQKPIKNLLIYNHYQNKYHSLFLMKAC
ncbi:MAG: hypothetical protein C5B59_13960 [Bacteroidetes bacterium]|nr:MAG: hypothetical protein C5B59_13960 [Bacteroidota bacterium]